jgi:hypothetical protein
VLLVPARQEHAILVVLPKYLRGDPGARVVALEHLVVSTLRTDARSGNIREQLSVLKECHLEGSLVARVVRGLAFRLVEVRQVEFDGNLRLPERPSLPTLRGGRPSFTHTERVISPPPSSGRSPST